MDFLIKIILLMTAVSVIYLVFQAVQDYFTLKKLTKKLEDQKIVIDDLIYQSKERRKSMERFLNDHTAE